MPSLIAIFCKLGAVNFDFSLVFTKSMQNGPMFFVLQEKERWTDDLWVV